MKIKINYAGDLAQQRFYDYIDENLKKSHFESWNWDITNWELFTFLLEQAKNHKLEVSGYESLEYKKDKDEAKRICRERENQEERGSIRR